MRLTEGQLMENRNGVIDERLRWPNKMIPYQISNIFTRDERTFIIKVLTEMEAKILCLKFVPWTPVHHDYIYIEGGHTGCWSYVGRQGGRQELGLHRNGCVSRRIIQYELLQAIGFYNELSRFDRDDWVTILWENVLPGTEHNFDKYSTSMIGSFGCPFDYKSIMLYDAYAFSKNGQKTIVTKDPNVEIGKSRYMSECDIKKVRNMYNCTNV